MSKFILDTRLSNAQYTICKEAIRRDIIEPEDLNENKRTMREQWWFWNHQPPLAAFPSPFAPHIKKGRVNQAVDGQSKGLVPTPIRRLAAFYESYGVDVAFNVAGETWHMDVLSHAQVIAAAKKIREERDKAVLHKGEHEKGVKFLKHQLHKIENPRTGKPYFKPLGDRPESGWGNHFDGELEDAVKNFQHDHRLTADGRVGKKTDRKIDKAYAKARKKIRKPAKQRAKERQAAAERGEL